MCHAYPPRGLARLRVEVRQIESRRVSDAKTLRPWGIETLRLIAGGKAPLLSGTEYLKQIFLLFVSVSSYFLLLTPVHGYLAHKKTPTPLVFIPGTRSNAAK